MFFDYVRIFQVAASRVTLK